MTQPERKKPIKANELDKFMSEKELSQQVRQLASLKGYAVYHTFLSLYSDVGFPDLCLAKVT